MCNKCDYQKEMHCDIQKIEQKCVEDNLLFFRTSAKSGENVDQIFEKAAVGLKKEEKKELKLINEKKGCC